MLSAAQPSKEELAAAKHYLVDEIAPREDFIAADYQVGEKIY
jgi:tRNA A37 N6-isopentenylltransferase MiaA